MKQYENPEFDIFKFSDSDILTSSPEFIDPGTSSTPDTPIIPFGL